MNSSCYSQKTLADEARNVARKEHGKLKGWWVKVSDSSTHLLVHVETKTGLVVEHSTVL